MRSRLKLRFAVGLTAAGVVLAIAILNVQPTPQLPAQSGSSKNVIASVEADSATPPAKVPQSLAELLALSAEELSTVDLGRMNLLCTEGLPGSESLRIADAMRKLDEWAAIVKHETDRHLYRATDPRYADHYRRSESYLRAEFLVQTLQETCGARYNPEKIYDPDFSDSRDQFIHGLMDRNHGGTCASLPALYAAVGRRLGYPIKLVMTLGHVFCRWDDPNGERFNIEGTNGFASHTDDTYQNWPYGVTSEMLATREYLVSLTPTEELAMFMAARGHCLFDRKEFAKSLDAYNTMARLAPTFRTHRMFVDAAQVAATKGFDEYERLFGKMPDRIAPPPPPASADFSRDQAADRPR